MEVRPARATRVARERHDLVSHDGDLLLGQKDLDIIRFELILTPAHEAVNLRSEAVEVAIDRSVAIWVAEIERASVAIRADLDAADPPAFGGVNLDIFNTRRAHVEAGVIVVAAKLTKRAAEAVGRLEGDNVLRVRRTPTLRRESGT